MEPTVLGVVFDSSVVIIAERRRLAIPQLIGATPACPTANRVAGWWIVLPDSKHAGSLNATIASDQRDAQEMASITATVNGASCRT